MHIKIHEAYRTIVALADSDIIGKTFEEGIKQIEVRPTFFQGDEKTKDEIIEILQQMDQNDATFNIVGNESIATALEAGIIEKHGIMKIQDVPIALGLF
tara:strand:+ start:2604 stop:2900 length:297 start_codon:yes stop_codon:yes gene_type:complete